MMATAAMTDPEPMAHARERLRLPSPRSAWWPFLAVILVAGLQFTQVFRRAINWDEFWHYTQIHQFEAGAVTDPLMTLHARVFSWVVGLPGTSVDHIVLIRLFMFGCELAACAAIFGLAARFSSRTTSLFCTLAYLSFPYVFQHGYSFRFDPPAAALMMGTLWLLASSRLDPKAILLAGLLIGTAAMVTIKIVLYAPAFAGLVWLRWCEHDRSRSYVVRLAGVGLASAACFGALFLFHAHGMRGLAGHEAKALVSDSAGVMFGFKDMPYWDYALRVITLAPITALLIGIAPFLLYRSARPLPERIALAGMLLPVTTLIFYHNTAPYYYAFMLPPVLIACCVSLDVFLTRFSSAVVTVLFSATILLTFLNEPPTPIDKQRELERTAQGIFPAGTNYFDFCGMLGSLTKANPFMTPVGIKFYQAGGSPTMRDTMERSVVPLVMNDDPMFARLFNTTDPAPEFLPADAKALRASYVSFWGPFWIAGKNVAADAAEHTEEFLVPGPYTVEGAAVRIDGKIQQPGAVVILGRGTHRLAAAGGKNARLLWGDRLKMPDAAPPEMPYWTPF